MALANAINSNQLLDPTASPSFAGETITASSSGATVTTTVTNTSNTASSNALQQVTVAGTSAGDAITTYTVSGTTNWSQGVDNSVSGDPFVIAASTALGTTNVMSAATTGEVNWPLQPAFLATLDSNNTDVTGNSGTATLGAGVALTEVYDVNGDFNTNGTFTAPVTGKYFFSVTMRTSGYVASTNTNVRFITSNRNYIGYATNPLNTSATGIGVMLPLVVMADMDAADTCTVGFTSTGEASNVVDIIGVATQTYFMGYLAI